MNKTKLAEYIATDPRGKAWLQQTHDITVVALGLDDVATLVNSSSEASVRVNVKSAVDVSFCVAFRMIAPRGRSRRCRI